MSVATSEFTREELLACVDREIRMRERVYSEWVKLGRMSGAASQRELAMMRSIRAVVAGLPPTPERQPALPGVSR